MKQCELIDLYKNFYKETVIAEQSDTSFNSLIDSYIKSAKLIFEAEDDQQQIDVQDEDEDIEDSDEDQPANQDDTKETNNEDTDESEDDANKEQNSEQPADEKIELKFSADLASEFGNTVNQFTTAAATIIKKRSINKEDSDKIYDIMSKIKNLLDAAGKSI